MEVLQNIGEVGIYKVREVIYSSDDVVPGVAIRNRKVVDIRRFEDDVPKNGICLTIEEASLMPALAFLKWKHNNAETPLYNGSANGRDFSIYEEIILRKVKDYQLTLTQVEFTKTGTKPLGKSNCRIDIRPWTLDYTNFNFGISCNDAEFIALCDMLFTYCNSTKKPVPLVTECKNSEIAESIYMILFELNMLYAFPKLKGKNYNTLIKEIQSLIISATLME